MKDAAAAAGALTIRRAHDLSGALHLHRFDDLGRGARERSLALVAVLTVVTMVGELLAGWWTGSLALTADGWHMGTHALALGGAWLAYRLAARAGSDYAFGGWKIEVLAAYTSGLALAAVALWLLLDAWWRLRSPPVVDFATALWVAVLGLAVNLASAALLMRGHGATPDRSHDHSHDVTQGAHAHAHEQAHDARAHAHPDAHPHRNGHDHNYSAAIMHVLADAFTSVLAIVALAGGAWLGWQWLDPVMAAVGALVILHWSRGVLAASARALVDATTDADLAARIREAIEGDGDATLADLHVWQVGGSAWCAALAVVADSPLPAAVYRERLAAIAPLQHVTVEVHHCPGCGGVTHATPVPATGA